MSIVYKLRILDLRATRRSLDASPRNLIHWPISVKSASKKPSSVANLQTSTISLQRVASTQMNTVSCLQIFLTKRSRTGFQKNSALITFPRQMMRPRNRFQCVMVTSSTVTKDRWLHSLPMRSDLTGFPLSWILSPHEERSLGFLCRGYCPHEERSHWVSFVVDTESP